MVRENLPRSLFVIAVFFLRRYRFGVKLISIREISFVLYIPYFGNISEIILDCVYVRYVRPDEGGLHKTTYNFSRGKQCEIGVIHSDAD